MNAVINWFKDVVARILVAFGIGRTFEDQPIEYISDKDYAPPRQDVQGDEDEAFARIPASQSLYAQIADIVEENAHRYERDQRLFVELINEYGAAEVSEAIEYYVVWARVIAGYEIELLTLIRGRGTNIQTPMSSKRLRDEMNALIEAELGARLPAGGISNGMDRGGRQRRG